MCQRCISASLKPDAFMMEIHFSLVITFPLPNARSSRLNLGGEYPTGRNHGYGSPVCLECPNSQFFEEAVKTKLQGGGMLTAILMPDGRAADTGVGSGWVPTRTKRRSKLHARGASS
jgi:hypothetical protein